MEQRNFQKEVSIYMHENMRLKAENIALAVALEDLQEKYNELTNKDSESNKEK